jgi:Leucine-rich repeat (LRR) protein
MRSCPAAIIVLMCLVAPVLAQPRPKPTYENVGYGPHERNVLDFWQAKSDQPTPVLVSIHGGGFVAGNKSVSQQLLKDCLASGISVAAINYRYSTQAIAPAPFKDGARAVQFLRSKARDWNIDPKRFAATGGSAGAGISLWLGFHKDMADPKSDDPVLRQSTRLACMVVFDGQTSYDPRFIRQLFPDKDVYKIKPLQQLIDFDPNNLDHLPADKYKLFEECSPITHVTKDSPPVLLFYSSRLDAVVSIQGIGIHHPLFGKALKEKMDKLRIPCEVVAGGMRLGGGTPTRPIDFLKEHFGMRKYRPKKRSNLIVSQEEKRRSPSNSVRASWKVSGGRFASRRNVPSFRRGHTSETLCIIDQQIESTSTEPPDRVQAVKAMRTFIAASCTVSFLVISAFVAADETEDHAIAVLTKKGASFSRDEKMPGRPVVLLDLANQEVDNEDLKYLAAFPYLQSLNLSDTHITNVGLKYVAKQTQLKTLYLKGSMVSDRGWKDLAPLKQLQVLDLAETDVSDIRLKDLAALTSLTTLNFARSAGVGGDTALKGTGLKDLSRLPQLRVLNLNGNSIADSAMDGLASLKALQDVDLSVTDITDKGLRQLACLTTLRSLNLGYTQITDTGLVKLTSIKPLTTLILNGTKVTDSGLKLLVQLNNLRSLELSDTGVTDVGVKNITRMVQLQKLNLRLTKVTDSGMRELASLKNLGELWLDRTKITDAAVKDLAGLTQLHSLGLALTHVTDAGLKHLVSLQNLRVLWLDSDKVTDEGMKSVGTLRRLVDLSLPGTQITDKGLNELAHLKNIEHLNIGATKITDKGLKVLASLKQLKTLKVYCPAITNAGLQHLRDALPECQIDPIMVWDIPDATRADR